jgi:diguanylate cyclase
MLLAALSALPRPAWAAAPPTLHLTGSEASVPLARTLEQLADPDGSLTAEQARLKPTGWHAPRTDKLAFGISRSVWWVRARMVNDTASPIDEVVDLGSAAQDYAHFTLFGPDGAVLRDSLLGDRVPHPRAGLHSRTTAFRFQLAGHAQADLLIRFHTHDGLFEVMPATISGADAFHAQAGGTDLVLALFDGMVLALTGFNLFMFIATRESSFGLYVLYSAAFLVNIFCFRGFDLAYLWPDWPGLHNRLVGFSAALSFAAAGLFGSSYLRLRRHAPSWLMTLLRSLILAEMAAAVLGALDAYRAAAVLGGTCGVVQMTLLLVCAVWLWRRGVRQARFAAVAFFALDVGVAIYYLEATGLVAFGMWSAWCLQAGAMMEMLVLAFGLADTLNVMRAQKLLAERSALGMQMELTTELEAQVAERTEALAAANRQLRRLALTDELTGAFNRRHFNNTLGRLVGPDRVRVQPLGLCVFDIDHFKLFNDTYGHPAGDAALRAVVGAVQDALRDAGDCLFRIGGEEFAVILGAGSADATRDCAERLRAAVEALAIPHALNSPKSVTASFGSAWWSAEKAGTGSIDRVFATVDRMLYMAKETGRNRVVCALLDDRLA